MYFKFRTLSSIVIFTLLITSVYATSNPLQAFATTQTLYGATGRGFSSLYQINPTSGDAIIIGEIKNGADPNPIGVSGLDFFGGVLYGAGPGPRGSTIASMETIDPSTGAIISLFNTIPKCADISFSPINGKLYCISPGASTLYTLEKTTGVATKVGDTGLAAGGGVGGALAVSPSDGTIFAGTFFALFTLSPDDGTILTAKSWVFPSDWSDVNCRPSAFAFDNANTLYASFICADKLSGEDIGAFLATVNTENGQVTQIGPTVASLDAIAFAPLVTPPSIPEFPFSFSLVIMFVVVAAVYMGMRQKMTFGKPRL